MNHWTESQVPNDISWIKYSQLHSYRLPETDITQRHISKHTQFTYLLTYVRSWALPEKLPIVQPVWKFPVTLRNPKVLHRVHKSPPLVPILSQFDPVPTIPSYLSKIHFNIVYPPTSWSCQWPRFLLTFPPISLYAFLVSPIRATCPPHLIMSLLTQFCMIASDFDEFSR
jgi:hypothetical protein